MAIVELKVKLIGACPLLMHNGQLADPTNVWTKRLKEVTSRKTKTEADHLEMRKIEFLGSLYTDETGKIAMPSDNVLGVLVGGAKKTKHGEMAKAGVFAPVSHYRFEYPGPVEPEALYEKPGYVDYRGVVVNGKSRVMRTRPIFKKWTVHSVLHVIDDVISESDVVQALNDGGMLCGLGDFTPRYGRFEVEVVSMDELKPAKVA